MDGWILSLLALGLWLYGLYLALTRTKSPTAKAVAGVALLGLFLSFGGTDLALTSEKEGYPFTVERTRTLPSLNAVEVALTNAEVVIRPGPGQLKLVYRAKSAAALARMRPVVEIEDGRLTILDDHQPHRTAYRVVLELPQPVAARVSVTNGKLKAKDRLKSLAFSATNGEARLEDYHPTEPTTIDATNGELALLNFAPLAPTQIEMINGKVRVEAARPLRIRAQVKNGAIRLPGETRTGNGGTWVTYGPTAAPVLVVRLLNGGLSYKEVKP